MSLQSASPSMRWHPMPFWWSSFLFSNNSLMSCHLMSHQQCCSLPLPISNNIFYVCGRSHKWSVWLRVTTPHCQQEGIQSLIFHLWICISYNSHCIKILIDTHFQCPLTYIHMCSKLNIQHLMHPFSFLSDTNYYHAQMFNRNCNKREHIHTQTFVLSYLVK